MKKYELRKLDPQLAKISGSDLSIEDLSTGRICITNKKYMDKLFGAVGYRNLGVIKILEEFAGKTINRVGDLGDYDIFVDDDTDSFVVTRKSSIEWVNRLIEYLDNNSYQIIQFRRYDDYYYWDQLWIKAPTGTYFSLYINLHEECVHCLALDYTPETGLRGINYESKYDLTAEDSFDSLTILLSNPINISYMYNLNQKLSYREYIDLLKLLGYLTSKRKMMCFTEEGDNLCTINSSLPAIVDTYNEMTWIQRCVNTPSITFSDVCELITANLDRVSFWDLKYFFEMNSKETSDFFVK